MNYWWVNQNQTYQHELSGGYLWSPKTTASGARNYFYDTMNMTTPGDIVFSFVSTKIKAIGIVSGPCQSREKPREFGTIGENWSDEGWYVPVTFIELSNQIRPKEHIDRLRPELPEKYSPLQKETGNGNQGVYLTSVPPGLAKELLLLIGDEARAYFNGLNNQDKPSSSSTKINTINKSKLLTTKRAQLIQARVGQGLFRLQAAKIESCCRITGISDPRFLIASHIKPWSKSKDEEKLDGYNGLLLAAHIDQLFDKGYLTFENNGQMKVSPQLPSDVFTALGLDSTIEPKSFTPEQQRYLDYHRSEVFLK